MVVQDHLFLFQIALKVGSDPAVSSTVTCARTMPCATPTEGVASAPPVGRENFAVNPVLRLVYI